MTSAPMKLNFSFICKVSEISSPGVFNGLKSGLPEGIRKKVFSKKRLDKITALTITNFSAIEKDLESIRKRGYAVSRGEREPDAFSVTAPVLDTGDHAVASLSISGPNFRLNDNNAKEYITWVLTASEEISQKLRYRRES
jgi:DNA-binding IclR family transcriptional regulator